jgi:hypothetical protein
MRSVSLTCFGAALLGSTSTWANLIKNESSSFMARKYCRDCESSSKGASHIKVLVTTREIRHEPGTLGGRCDSAFIMLMRIREL